MASLHVPQHFDNTTMNFPRHYQTIGAESLPQSHYKEKLTLFLPRLILYSYYNDNHHFFYL